MLAPGLTKWETNSGKVVYPTHTKPTGTCRLVATQMQCDGRVDSSPMFQASISRRNASIGRRRPRGFLKPYVEAVASQVAGSSK